MKTAADTQTDSKRRRIVVISRCGWTLFNFRAGLVRALLAAGHDVVTAGAEDPYADRVRALGVEFISLPVSLRPLNPIADARLVAEMVRLFRRVRPDVVHNFTIKPVVMGSIAAALANVPRTINTITGLGYAFTGKRHLLRSLVETLYRIALRKSDHTFFQNRTDYEYFTQRGLVTRSASVVTGSGVDLARFASTPVPQRTPITFLMVARLLKDKGVLEYFDASRSTKSRYGNAVAFELLGEIDSRNPTAISEDTVRKWEADGAGRWLGHSDDVTTHLQRAHVIVLPSYREGAPRSLMEAASIGRAAIATDVPGCRDVVEDQVTGLLVPPRDAEAVGRAMALLIDNPALIPRMGCAARARAEALFAEDAIIEATIQRYFALA